MTIKLTKEQMQQILKDGWALFNYSGDNRSFSVYLEMYNDGNDFLSYFEFANRQDGKRSDSFAVSREDLQKLLPNKPTDPSWHHNYPLCPNCGTYMIYHFEHCPKCGQKLDWSGFTDN